MIYNDALKHNLQFALQMAKRRKGADQTIIEVNAISDVEEEETALPAAAPPPAPPPAQVGHTCEYLDALFSKQNNTEVGHTSARQTATFAEPSNSEREAVGGQEERFPGAAHYFPDRPLTESEIQRDRERERWV